MNAIKVSANSLAYFNAMVNHTDRDFSSCGNPLGIECDDECESDLNGYYGSFNHIWVRIEGDNTENPTITIHANQSGKEIRLEGKNAHKVLNRIKDDVDYCGSHYAIYLNTYKYVL